MNISQLEKRDVSASQTLRAALIKAETAYPGLTYDLVLGIIRKTELTVNMNDSILRLQGAISDSDGEEIISFFAFFYYVFPFYKWKIYFLGKLFFWATSFKPLLALIQATKMI